MIDRLVRWLALIALLVAVPMAVDAQGTTRCSFSSERFATDSTPLGRVTYFGGNVRIRCPSRGITLRGDSAEQRPDGDHVIGHAVYDEPRFHITADFLNYFQQNERVVAVGNVNARLPSGSTLVGPIAEYNRAVPRIRTRATMLARARPTVTIVEKDSAGKPVPPTTVIAETIFLDGDSLVYASGRVSIARPDITATADSVFMDQGRETMRLMVEPMLKGQREKPYTLTGDLIDLFSQNRKLTRILSQGTARAVSDSMTLSSDTLDLRVRDDLMERAFAWGAKSRARVESPSQNLIADSLDVVMPGQRIRVVRAVRRALAESTPDTTRFVLEKRGEKDWLRGDTIIAHFDSTAVTDTARRNPEVRNLAASGHASSFYHLAPSDTSERRPAINYLVARLINIVFDRSRVATVTSVDSVSGLYVEPRPDSTARHAVTTQRANTNGSTNRPLPTSIIPLPPKRP